MTSAMKTDGTALAAAGADDAAELTVHKAVLLRVASGSATRADLQRDLAELFTPRLSGTEFRRRAELAIAALTGKNLVSESRGRMSATAAGMAAADPLAPLVKGGIARASWGEVRDMLVIQVLRMTPTPAVVKALMRPEGVAGLVLQRHFSIHPNRVLSMTDLRSALAVVALERAFGNKIKTGLAKGSGLPGKAGRLLAGQLFKSPREIASDGKLATALAGEVLGLKEVTVETLKTALVKRLTIRADGPSAGGAAAGASGASVAAAIFPDNDEAPLKTHGAPLRAVVYTPPDMDEFCAAVLDAARPVSEGWPGNRKAFISLVWQAIRNSRPNWGLTQVAFKSMLAEAHRAGRLELVGADLKDGRDLRSLEDSKILYKNTVWHFVRVED